MGGLLDGVRGVEVGFADGEVDYVDALGFELGTLLRHCQGGGWLETVESCGESHGDIGYLKFDI
jgi:hypothetical protein